MVPIEALKEFEESAETQYPEVLPYLQASDSSKHCSYNIDLRVSIREQDAHEAFTVCTSNFRNIYWTIAQQIAHHTVTGCNLRAGDVLASGTISGEQGECVNECAYLFNIDGVIMYCRVLFCILINNCVGVRCVYCVCFMNIDNALLLLLLMMM